MTRETKQTYLSYSGGVTSWAAGRILVDELGPENVTLLFADTTMEAPDVYAFVIEGMARLGVPLFWIADGRNPWQVMRDERMIANNFKAVCSKKLKRELIDRWRREWCDPETTVHAVGMDCFEIERFETHRALMATKGWTSRAPLIEHQLTKTECMRMAEAEGLTLPAAYAEGFAHANCAGMCIRAGIGHWRRLLRIHPDRFRLAESRERELQDYLQKEHTFLERRIKKKRTPFSLTQLRTEEEAKLARQPDLPIAVDDGGGCGCALEGH